jgi:hypothetical protein
MKSCVSAWDVTSPASRIREVAARVAISLCAIAASERTKMLGCAYRIDDISVSG